MESKPLHDLLIAGDICIDNRQRTVTVANISVEFTCKEFDVLFFLCQHRGWALTKQQILDAIWKTNPEADYHAVENMIYKIRKKISASQMVRIQTMVGYGYKLIELKREHKVNPP